MMVNDKDKMQKSIDELTEWQENQYNPGHWIGGITPNNLLSPRKPKIVGWFLILISLMLLLSFIFVFIGYADESMNLLWIEQFFYIVQLVGLGGFALLLLIGGIRKVVRK